MQRAGRLKPGGHIMHLLLALLSVTATCTPDPALAARGPERVRAYFAAINARDAAAIGRFIRPGTTFSMPGIAGLPLDEVMTGFIETPQAEQLEVVETRADGDQVTVRTLAVPSRTPASATVRLDGGCVSRFVQD